MLADGSFKIKNCIKNKKICLKIKIYVVLKYIEMRDKFRII